jgi:hypothetical protein
MHTKKDYRFDNETAAQEFADRHKVDGVPPVDTYVRGPFFMDEAVMFKGIIAPQDAVAYWNVEIEIYN